MVNKITLIGHLGKDPELKHLESGVAVARVTLATNENYKDKNGEWQKLTEWHNIVIWRDQAERAAKYAKKGMQVFVEGKVTYRKYTDKDNVERFITEVVAETFRILEKVEYSTPEATAAASGASADMAAEGDGLPF